MKYIVQPRCLGLRPWSGGNHGGKYNNILFNTLLGAEGPPWVT